MASDKVREARIALDQATDAFARNHSATTIARLEKATSAFEAAVRADEREKAIAMAEAVEVWNRDSADAKRDIAEAIRNA